MKRVHSVVGIARARARRCRSSAQSATRAPQRRMKLAARKRRRWPTRRRRATSRRVRKLDRAGRRRERRAGRRHDRVALGGRARRLGDGDGAPQGARRTSRRRRASANYTPLHVASRDAAARRSSRALLEAGADVKAIDEHRRDAAAPRRGGWQRRRRQRAARQGRRRRTRGNGVGSDAARYSPRNTIAPTRSRALLKHGADPSIHTKAIEHLRGDARASRRRRASATRC